VNRQKCELEVDMCVEYPFFFLCFWVSILLLTLND